MLKALSLAGAALAMSAAALLPATPAVAQSHRHDDRRDHYRQDLHWHDRYRDDRRHRDHRRCDSGDGGTIIGAIAGGLLGHEIAGRGDRTLGTVVGAGGGALAGHAIDRSNRPGYCRR